jgi:hypothetical protein
MFLRHSAKASSYRRCGPHSKEEEPPSYAQYAIAPPLARFDPNFGEFLLPYESMRQSADPDAALLEFLQSTYEAAANCAQWDRSALEV